ncbi:Piso0_004760 [Millerozyma farinosa CBS 7064]|uniref:Piso0_004760 protein n=1 Tax=Pichia sorbitophila (strain ATCC MYA-4447 / BCRC 22081 / CBS 7064 / NBRC 10061 / NRRL Y-12695) TaxID=559304 RepID=G8Y3B0_PICSO|nr:Piso0_004760 [Millerozyma farinosa CBS 7064]
MMTLLLLLLYFFASCFGDGLEGEQIPLKVNQDTVKGRIAIIGAGAGGSSAAYYLQKYTNHGFNITIYEKSNYIGGRATTVPIGGNSSYLVETGASIFVSANKILSKAVEDFNFETQAFREGAKKVSNADNRIGIWNGNSILVIFSDSIMDKMKLFLRYGLDIFRSLSLSKQFVQRFLDYYYNKLFPFESLNTAAYLSDFLNYTKITGRGLFTEKGISDLFSLEFIQSLTRVNYAQDLESIHAIGTLVCLAANNARQVKGGNWQIFRKFIESSKADLKLKETVKSIKRDNVWNKWQLEHVNSETGNTNIGLFDDIIIATPFDQANIEGDNINIPSVEYVHLHVTFFVSNSALNASFFGKDLQQPFPSTILTTPFNQSDENSSDFDIPIYSLSLIDYIEERRSYVYKIFSKEKLTDDFIREISGSRANISWVYRKEWYSYPKLHPTTNFTDFKVADGLWYLNGMETFISTMETSALAGANVAGLISLGRNTSDIILP